MGLICYRSSGGPNTEENRSSKTSAPPRPNRPAVYSPSNINNVGVQPSRAAPAPPSRPDQSTAYSVSAGVAIVPARAAPTPPNTAHQPPAKPPKPEASQLPPQPLNPQRLTPVRVAWPERPPLPQKPVVS